MARSLERLGRTKRIAFGFVADRKHIAESMPVGHRKRIAGEKSVGEVAVTWVVCSDPQAVRRRKARNAAAAAVGTEMGLLKVVVVVEVVGRLSTSSERLDLVVYRAVDRRSLLRRCDSPAAADRRSTLAVASAGSSVDSSEGRKRTAAQHRTCARPLGQYHCRHPTAAVSSHGKRSVRAQREPRDYRPQALRRVDSVD